MFVFSVAAACAQGGTEGAISLPGAEGGTLADGAPGTKGDGAPGSSGGGSGSSSGGSGSSSGGSGSSSGGTQPSNEDASTGQPCVHNSDCVAGVANLCEGNNGVACILGFCVATGKPENCDDGIACTSDSCNVSTNQCAHTPTDSACPADSYCDPTNGCVANLPCTAGGSVCDRLDVSACEGLWSCQTVDGGGLCVQGAAPCGSVTSAVTLCNGVESDGGLFDGGVIDAGIATDGGVGCAWECNAGYAHLVWTGSLWVQETTLTPPAPAACECQITSTTDAPEYTGANAGFVDQNCDGIDGTVAHAIFVSPSGSDGNAGTMDHPKQTITAAITAAQSAGKDVYADMGTYNETVTLVSGVSLYGGYDSTNKWQRAIGNESHIQSGENVGLVGNSLDLATTVQFFTITSAAGASGTGESSTGVEILSSPGPVLLQGCTVAPGAGGSGIAPVAATVPQNGNPGNGQNGGTSSCGAAGGPGGAAVTGPTGGNSGIQGSGPSGGGPGGGGGAGTGCCDPFGSAGNGTGGSPGGNGNNGSDTTTAAAQIGTLQSSGSYVPASGAGGTSGTAASGGGGGGSGGAAAACSSSLGCAADCEFDTCNNFTSAYGGGGGAGGCGGGGGNGGGGGGGSFGVVAVGSTLTIDQCTIDAATGGAATAGGAGAGGGTAGGGTGGGTAGTDCGTGGSGGNGGVGGNGGNGSGGTGGPSICVYYSGTVSPTYTSNTCSRAGGGAAGGSGGGTAPAGYQGLDAEIQGG
jgi:hypothetical protein